MKEFRFRKTILIATLVALFSVLLAACGGDDPTATPVPADNPTPTPERPAWEVTWDATVAAAVEEGKVVVTSCGGEGRRIAMTEGFEAAYPGITLEHSPINSRDLWPRVVTEAKLGQHNFDVRIGGADTTTFSAMNTNNTHAVLDFDEWFILPEVRDPEVWLGGMDFGWLDKGHQFAWSIPLTTSAGEGFWVNRNLISEAELSSVSQLSDPKWKGQIVSLSSEGGGAQNTMMMQMIGYGDEWMQGVLDNEPILLRDHRAQLEGLIRGQYAIATTVDANEMRDFRAEGLDLTHLDNLADEVGSLSNACESLQLHADMPHPNAAKVYVNWLLSHDQQQVWNDSVPTNSRRLDTTPGRPTIYPSAADLENFRLSQDETLSVERARFAEFVQGVLIK
jgi:iron(III) transport system substrate-binding protein